MTAKVVLFFLAGTVPTTPEAAAIARMSSDPNISLRVRNSNYSVNYGAGPEKCDGVAALNYAGLVPAALQTLVTGGTLKNYSNESAGGPASLTVVSPGGASVVGTASSQFAALLTNPDGTITDVTRNANTVWSSATTAKATVGAATGVVTGVAAGTSVITATYTYDVPNTLSVAGTKTVTVS